MIPEGNLSLEEKKKKCWFVYECSPSSETRGSAMTSEHCWMWSVRASKHTREELEARRGNIQTNCKHKQCNNRPRKSVGQLWFFDTEWDAFCFAERMNSEVASNVFE